MLIDLKKFIIEERPYWNELESVLDSLEKRPELKLNLSRIERFHYLYQRTSGGLAKIKTFASEPNTRAFLESLVARAYGEIHETRKRPHRLGDIVANTIVVWNPHVDEPDLDQLLEGKYNSFRNYPYLEARLRQHISPSEARIALQALVRRDGLEPRSRVILFENIAAHFKSIVSFPVEATDGISDEQYIRNVVDALYRTNGLKG